MRLERSSRRSRGVPIPAPASLRRPQMAHVPRRPSWRHLPALLLRLVTLVPLVVALPSAAQTQTNTQSTQRAINFLSADVVHWTQENNCVACHRQGAVVYGLSSARANGYDMNAVVGNGRTNLANLELLAQRIRNDQLANGSWIHEGTAFRYEKTSFSVFGLAGYDENVSTQYSNALVNAANWALTTQEPSGRWPSDHAHFPVDHGSVSTTARIMTGMAQAKQRVDPARAAAYQAALDRAAAYLRANLNNNDTSAPGNGMPYTFQVAWTVLGLKAAGPGLNDVNTGAINTLAERLITRTSPGNAGWGNLPNEAANDFATGSAIYALCLAGREPATDPRLRNAIEWMKTRQSADGSWRTGSATFDIPTTFAALGLSCFGDFSVRVSVVGAERQELLVDSPSPQQATFTFTVKNHGYQADTYTLSTQGGLPGWTASVSPVTLFLPAGGEGTVTVTVHAPPRLLPALTSAVTLIASSGGAPGVTGSARVAAYTPPLPPVTGLPTVTTIVTPAANARVTIGNGTLLSARVTNGGAVVPGPAHGVVTFYVAGVPVGADVDADGDGIYAFNWVPAVDSWTVTGAQDYRAVYSGVERQAPLANLLGSTASSTLIIDPFPHLTPMVTIGNPPAFTRETALDIWGYATPRAPGAVITYAAFIINGGAPIVLTPGNGGLIHTSITLEEGPNIIQMTARDSFGGVTTKQVNLTVDRVAPILTILSPAENAAVNTPVVMVRSSVQDQTPVRVETQWVNSSLLEFGNGTVEHPVNVSYGSQVILVRATDSAGNVTEKLLYLWVDAGTPVVSTHFADGQLYGPLPNDTFQYAINVQTVSATTVRVNGGPAYNLPRGGGQIQASVTLAPGVNTLGISVISETGMTANLVRRVNYDVQAPTATLLSPTAGSTVSGAITVRARVTDNFGPVTNVGFSRDMSGIRVGTQQSDGTWTAQFDTREMVNGAHTIDLWMNDGVGNFAVQSFNIVVSN
ncbi:ABC transporter substrate-binding protein [Myxococcus xanthus]|uniref:ABC transporter substrate-binding protein n=2 Tax=Myxococcus xanthus TaxID=34 RepID=A0A7Y4MS67_MYXXA|nr:ABC transporter substrate-binding protein [Myxococcus xanthus]NOJ86318.1 ABC transporter substrate-binding protein [Myxococcus xanthus]